MPQQQPAHTVITQPCFILVVPYIHHTGFLNILACHSQHSLESVEEFAPLVVILDQQHAGTSQYMLLSSIPCAKNSDLILRGSLGSLCQFKSSPPPVMMSFMIHHHFDYLFALFHSSKYLYSSYRKTEHSYSEPWFKFYS